MTRLPVPPGGHLGRRSTVALAWLKAIFAMRTTTVSNCLLTSISGHSVLFGSFVASSPFLPPEATLNPWLSLARKRLAALRRWAAVATGAVVVATLSPAPALGSLPSQTSSSVDKFAVDPVDALESGPLERPDEASAVALARKTGERVGVSGKRSETDEVFANPDGSFSAELRSEPVRVHRGEQWVPIDVTLLRRSDGWVAPVAGFADVALSGGGTGPMVRIQRDGKALAFSWPVPCRRRRWPVIPRRMRRCCQAWTW